jgi:hypothetical protein
MERFQLQHRRKFFRAAQLMTDDVRRDFGRERERKSHKGEDSNSRPKGVNDPGSRCGRRLCDARTQSHMAQKTSETVAVLGASPKPDRYAYRAMQMLRQHGHRAVPVNPAFPEILGETCYRSLAEVPGPVDTVTMYLGKQRSDPLIEEIINAKPRRIIMNPGAENDELAAKAEKAGIEVDYACTLVMLQTGGF